MKQIFSDFFKILDYRQKKKTFLPSIINCNNVSIRGAKYNFYISFC